MIILLHFAALPFVPMHFRGCESNRRSRFQSDNACLFDRSLHMSQRDLKLPVQRVNTNSQFLVRDTKKSYFFIVQVNVLWLRPLNSVRQKNEILIFVFCQTKTKKDGGRKLLTYDSWAQTWKIVIEYMKWDASLYWGHQLSKISSLSLMSSTWIFRTKTSSRLPPNCLQNGSEGF